MNRLLSVVSMGLARRWKTILMFLGAWWIITSFLMKIFANGDLSTFGTYFPIYFDNEIAIILLLIGIGYIVEQFRLESQLGLTRKEQIESLFIQTLVDSGIITLIYALLIPLRNGVSLGSVTIQSILGTYLTRKYRYQHSQSFREGCSDSPNRKCYWDCS